MIMFGKKKNIPRIDKEQLELIQNAQRRVKQKKRLHLHLVLFLICSLFLILANLALGIRKDITFFDFDWYVLIILVWVFLLLFHVVNVFITHKFMGKDWEQKQLDTLVMQQKQRIDKLKEKFIKEEVLIAQSEVYNENRNNSKKKAELTIIVAAGENNEIGKDNKLIWHLKDDLKHFKNLTNGHHIIMGRKTFESFPKPLPNRIHVVITRQNNYQVTEGVIVVNSLTNAIDVAKNDNQPFIIGGGEIYKQAMALADKIELTRVHKNFEADTFFPEIDSTIWKKTSNTFHDKDEDHKYSFSFITYKRT